MTMVRRYRMIYSFSLFIFNQAISFLTIGLLFVFQLKFKLIMINWEKTHSADCLFLF